MSVDNTAGNRTRILFVAEAVTLAHVARPAALAAGLDPAHWEVHIAQCPRYRELLGDLHCTEHAVHSIEPGQFTAALARGAPLYDLATLEAYLEADLGLLDAVRPDLVVGDFRLSLPVAAQIRGVPSVTLGNACWSPYAQQGYPAPDLPVTRALGPRLGQWLFSAARPFAFALHSRPMAALRRRHGLPSLGPDLRRVYTHGDYTLYCDIPGLYEMRPLPANHRVIGPVPWSPSAVVPDWWDALPDDRPLVYATPGSSGHAGMLPALLQALAELPVAAMVATAGAGTPTLPGNVWVAPYLPGHLAARRAAVVVCNGGSPTTQQALACGRPVLGIAGNLDQFLNMQALERVGAGLCLRADNLTSATLATALQRLLQEPSFTRAAEALAAESAAVDGVAGFARFLEESAAPWSGHGRHTQEVQHA